MGGPSRILRSPPLGKTAHGQRRSADFRRHITPVVDHLRAGILFWRSSAIGTPLALGTIETFSQALSQRLDRGFISIPGSDVDDPSASADDSTCAASATAR